MEQIRKIWKKRKRAAAIILILAIGLGKMIPSVPVYGSNVWPQKSTAPYYCLDGGKSWRAADQYADFHYDTLPSALTEVQARRLFWAYPSNWNALKAAAQIHDPELYAEISETVSGPNVVKKVKDDSSTKFAWIADHPEIEARAIAALEKASAKTEINGKEAPGELQGATQEEDAVSIVVPAFSDGPGSLVTEFRLGEDFVGDIANIEALRVWDNGASGKSAGWVDASLEQNRVKTVMGNELYGITWGKDSITIRNNGSAIANETAVGSRISEEERTNKTTILYKITMRENSGWISGGSWDPDYLHQWMEFKGCINAPEHQRLYMADIRFTPAETSFYFIVRQDEPRQMAYAPAYGNETADQSFQIYRHDETFRSTYNVKLTKLDHETGMPLKGSQFHLYESFESKEEVGESEEDGGLNKERLSFEPWDGFQVFSEGTTNADGEIFHTDIRMYEYSKTFCDGHAIPQWVSGDSEEDEEEEEDEEDSGDSEEDGEEGSDANREAAAQWISLADSCEEKMSQSDGRHFHWFLEEDSYEQVLQVLDSGIGDPGSDSVGAGEEEAFERSGCKEDRAQTYENFIELRFAYTWEEVQARYGYIRHGLHNEDVPIDIISINASEAGGEAEWIIYNHRTEGEIHMNKRNMDLFAGEHEEYSSYGDNEGDGTLAGAVYGLFAAEDIIHPDAELAGNGNLTNTGIVYRKNDLVSVAETDINGNAAFMTYTVAPGMEYDHETEQIKKRTDIDWSGPVNRHEKNLSKYGNWWIGRPLILGTYYVKELSRSEGYELSVNGRTGEWTNFGAGFDTPKGIADAEGTVIISMPDLGVSMEGEGDGGLGYDEFLFEVTSAGTAETENDLKGYEIIVHGFPEGTVFYRVDTGEQEVTGPRVVGTEKVILKDEDGNIIWKKAQTDKSNIKYEPLYGDSGEITGQKPMIKKELQTLQANHIPAILPMEITEWEMDTSDPIWEQNIADADDEELKDIFYFLKAETESFLYRNGYEVPRRADGSRSKPEDPVFNMGVLKDEIDIWGMTTAPMEPAVETVYGSALKELEVEWDPEETTVYDVFESILFWYCDHPQWSFAGIHSMIPDDPGCRIQLYIGDASKSSRRFFTMRQIGGTIEPDLVYAVYENPVTLRWEYQEYREYGEYQYQIQRQYSYGTGGGKRHYIDAILTPAMMTDQAGILQPVENSDMIYYRAGEELMDYISGDPEYGYRIPETKSEDRIEITTELELTEQDVELTQVSYDRSADTYRIKVLSEGTDSFGRIYSDANKSLTLSFMAKLPYTRVILSESDIHSSEISDTYEYQAGDEIGYVEYLMQFKGASVSVMTGEGESLADTYLISKPLVYKGQQKVREDGNTSKTPVQVLERPIKQKIKVIKRIEGEDAIQNFRFKLYLKANLERLFCDEDGMVQWLDPFGDPVDVLEYKERYPQLVQNFYTERTGKPVLESIQIKSRTDDENEEPVQQYNYEKFFDAVETANTDKWDNPDQKLRNTSWKPLAIHRITGVENQINTSAEAKENARRSDAVRQFAVTWYLEDQIQKLVDHIPNADRYQVSGGGVTYSEALYDRALYLAIQEAETYLKVFFNYDLDEIFGIHWDTEKDGGIDLDPATLAADQMEQDGDEKKVAYGISPYLPYGAYVLREQQPYRADLGDFKNRHYKIDTPKELSLPMYYNEQKEIIDPSLVPWSMTEPGEKSEWSGYADRSLTNQRYQIRLRVEKTDEETGEPILHAGAVFGLYRAERNESEYGDGKIKRYEKDTLISGSKPFLQAMGAGSITSFAKGAGDLYSGWVSAGTPICYEDNCILFSDQTGSQTGVFSVQSTVRDCLEANVLQVTGFFETSEPLEAGVYVLAELVPPDGYVRSEPTAVEIYSDSVMYDLADRSERITAIRYGEWKLENNEREYVNEETARLFLSNIATSLEVSKIKTMDTGRSMKVSGRVEGSISALQMIYGLENLELAYNAMGTYLGFGWKKGTLEYLEQRRLAGEQVEFVYEQGVFQGYGYVTRELDTADDDNRYVPGAKMALFEAIEVKRNGDTEDRGFDGVQITRDRNQNVVSIIVKEGYAGDSLKIRQDTPVLFYDLSDLKVLEKSDQGEYFGYDRNGQKTKITFDTRSIFAMQNGHVEFEITGEDLTELVYDPKAKAFINMDPKTILYHLDENGCRDAKVDPYTGLAYVDAPAKQGSVYEQSGIYVWPVYELKDSGGNVIRKEKILTGRPGEKKEGTDQAYITGTIDVQEDDLIKEMNPVYDRYGMVQYYPKRDVVYQKGEEIYDRDGDEIGYRYDDLLGLYGQAAFDLLDSKDLYHRSGEAWIIPNIWISGEEMVQDKTENTMTLGKADVLRRVIPGTYVLEELEVPDGYVRAFPAAVCVEESAETQRVSVVDERTKVEIAKTGYSHQLISGVKMALYQAKRVYTSEYHKYPKGYYLKKIDDQKTEKVWISSDTPHYFEGIPSGDYILEELDTPVGYVPETMEITVQPVSHLQSFILKNDHTKLEIYKYRLGDDQTMQPLQWPDTAGFSLYPAILDAEGQVIIEKNEMLHEKEAIAEWETGRQLEYADEMMQAYENMFTLYKDTFEIFSWYGSKEGKEQCLQAKKIQEQSTANGEKITQLWQLEDDSRFRVTVDINDGLGREGSDGKRIPVFEYQFHYSESEKGTIISYDLANGIHRLDRIPAGNYILKETTVPDGYEETLPVLIRVEGTGDIQRYDIENRYRKEEPKGKLQIEKTDWEDPNLPLAGAVFEVKNLQSGQTIRVTTDERGQAMVSDLPVNGTYESGEAGPVYYEVREVSAPDGYQCSTFFRRFCFKPDEDGRYEHLMHIKNTKTSIHFSKQNFDSGYFVEGAKLAVYEAELKNGTYQIIGEPLEQWVSGKEDYVIKGKLSGGKTYFLVEEGAPDGYISAPPVRFTLSTDGKRILEISQNLTQFSVEHNEKEQMESISVIGHAAVDHIVTLESISTGSKENLYSQKEVITFSDGSRCLLENTIFRDGSDQQKLQEKVGSWPVKTTYVLKNSEGIVVEQWTLTEGLETHIIYNKKVSEDTFLFSAGQELQLYEYVTLGNGSRVLTGRFSLCIDHDGAITAVDLKNKETSVSIEKSNLLTGRPLPNAKLSLRDAKGKIVDQWVSEMSAHIINGKLAVGETYTLTEERPPDGFSYADPISFAVDNSGFRLNVRMDDRPTHVEIQKVDAVTGEGLIGAELILEDSEKNLVDQWISDKGSHVIRGKLLAGETYVLSETSAPKGYRIGEPIVFTVSSDGTVDRIVMENRKITVTDEFDDTDDPKDSKDPEAPAAPIPPPDPEEQIETKTYGTITAVYKVYMGRTGRAGIRIQNGMTISTLPKTGDETDLWKYVWGILVSLIGCLLLLKKKKKNRDPIFRAMILFLFLFLFPIRSFAGSPEQMIYEGPVFSLNAEVEPPERILEKDGKQYRLISSEIVEATKPGILTYVSASIPYELEGMQKVPETALITIEDEDTGDCFEREVPWRETTEIEMTWRDNFSFPLTVHNYGADVFYLGDHEIPAYAELSGYGELLLEYLALAPEYYRIETVEWIGDPYEQDNMVCRDAMAYGEKLVRYVDVIYGGQIQTPDFPGQRYVALYEEMIPEIESFTEPESEMQEANTEERFSERITRWIREHITVVAFSSVFLLALCGWGLLLFLSSEKKKKEKPGI